MTYLLALKDNVIIALLWFIDTTKFDGFIID